MLVIPTPESIYRGNYASLPANTLKPPIESNRTVPIEINWLNSGLPPQYTIHFNARQQQTLPISQISALHIDNSQASSSMHVAFPDTQFEVIVGPNTVGFYPVVTNSLEFWCWIDKTPLAQDKTIIQVLNFLPPPIFFTTQPGGTGVGTVREVDTVGPIQGGPITDIGTISLATPLALNFGGTGGSTAAAGLDNLSGASGTLTGALSRSSGGVWSVQPSPVTPVTVPNGGTGQVALATGNLLVGNGTNPVSVPAALNWNTVTLTITGGLAVSAAAAFAGATTAPTVAAADNSTAVATTAFVKAQGYATTAQLTGGYLPLSGGLLSGGLASGPGATPVPGAGALTLNANTVAPVGFTAGNLNIIGANSAFNNIFGYGYSTGYTQFSGYEARGTAAAPTAVQLGDTLVTYAGYGYTGSAYSAAQARITFSAAENWTGTAQGTLIDLVTASAGGTSQVVSLRLQGNTATFSGNVVSNSNGGAPSNFAANASVGDPLYAMYSANRGWVAAGIQQSSGMFYISDLTAPATRLTITTTGTCSASSAWGVISDAAVKTDIIDHPRGLADILKLQPRQFTYTGAHGLDGPGQGLIAQELEAVMPELVGEMATADGGTVKTVTETGIIWPLVNAIKEMKAEIDSLKAQLGGTA